MCCAVPGINITGLSKSTKKQSAVRLIAVALCICFIAASLLSAAFILAHENHEHDHNAPGGSCSTCAQMAAAGNLLKQLSLGLVSTALAFGSMFAARSLFKHISFDICFYTLVKLKVRLNN